MSPESPRAKAEAIISRSRQDLAARSAAEGIELLAIDRRLAETSQLIEHIREVDTLKERRRLIRQYFGGPVLQLLSDLAAAGREDGAEEAFLKLQQGLQERRRSVLRNFSGWRRLAFRIALDGTHSELVKLFQFARGERHLRIERYAEVDQAPRFAVSPSEFPTIAPVKHTTLDVSDLNQAGPLLDESLNE